VHLSGWFANPRSTTDHERIRPLLVFVDRIMRDRYRPQLLQLTAYGDGPKPRRTQFTNQAVRWVIVSYRYATHLKLEHLGDA
jgi:hypothetical protein